MTKILHQLTKYIAALILGVALLFPAPQSKAGPYAGIGLCAASSLAVSGASNNVLLSTCGPTVILFNVTSQEAFFTTGTTSATAATTSSYSIPGNAYIVISISLTTTYLAAITSTSTTTIRILQGWAES
jgi:hypothetical protein